MRTFFRFSCSVLLLLSSTLVIADDQSELLKLKNTTLNLINALVKEGILTREHADKLIQDAETSAVAETRSMERKANEDKSVVRVPYVPDFVRDEIRDQIRNELREDVVKDVMSQAKTERWGVPGVLPEWTTRIKLKGDIRLREQSDFFASQNNPFTYANIQEVNKSGSIAKAGDKAFFNTTENRHRLRARMRLDVEAKISNDLKAGIRFTSGSFDDPVSSNQTLGTTGRRWKLGIDRTYLKYNRSDSDGYNWLTLVGGRFANPWFHTDMVWDKDLNFDGIAATMRFGLGGSDGLLGIDEKNKTVFLTLGAFPLQEVDVSSDDKWLFGAQTGLEWIFENQSIFKIGLAYYDYWNITGKQNEPFSTLNDFTAPEFVQKGNSVFDIQANDPSVNLFALASDYNLVNLTTSVDLAYFSPIHLVLTADYVKNIGFDKNDIFRRTGFQVRQRTDGYQLGFVLGWPKIRKYRDWQVFAKWKYLERDAVLDAFTDSDFHLGGTDTKGWIVGGSYGLNENTWLKVRWLSSDEITGLGGEPLGIDTVQLDVNTRF